MILGSGYLGGEITKKTNVRAVLRSGLIKTKKTESRGIVWFILGRMVEQLLRKRFYKIDRESSFFFSPVDHSEINFIK